MRAALSLSIAVLALASCAHPAPAVAPARPTRAGAADEDMVAIPTGTFLRGRADSLRADESPPHEVRIHAFYMDRTLVTRAAFARFVAATGYRTSAEELGYGVAAHEGMRDWEWERAPGGSWRRPFSKEDPDAASFLRDDAPVVMVSFRDADAYCRHRGARLPTEAEWEYAMRAGAKGTRYPWGDAPERDGKLGLNFWQGTSHATNLREDGWVYVSPVRAYPPNAWGLFDAVGNVWQWTADWYSPDTYATAAKGGSGGPVTDPTGPATGKKRVLRGGSWWCGACVCEGNGLFYRGKADPEAPFNNNGFRCAKDASQ